MISVAMCTYNGEKFLKEQLESIFSQTCQPDEIIISDDCSKDHTVQLAYSLLAQWNGKWKIVQNKENMGFRKNFEQAIQLCQGDIIFLSDQDDVWLPEKIETMVAVFARHPDVILAFHDAELVDRNLTGLGFSFWDFLDFKPACFKNLDYRQLIGHNVVQGSACAFRKNLVSSACPFPQDIAHDEWLGLVALVLGNIFPISKKLLKYRQWESNVIGGRKKSIEDKLVEYIFSIRKVTHIHREFLFNKNKVNRKWLKRYREVIQLKYPNIIDSNDVMQKRELYIRKKNLKIIFLAFKYLKIYPCPQRALKEFIRDVLTISVNEL